MKKKITKKVFYEKLQELGKTVRHSGGCEKVWRCPLDECTCHEETIWNKDINWINRRLKDFKTYLEAVKTFLEKLDKEIEKNNKS